MARAARPTFGRDGELERLDVLVGRLRDGQGAVCVIEGEPGIGKSQLVGELARRAESAAISVLIGHAELLERGRPFHVVQRLFPVDPGPADTMDAQLRPGLEPMMSGRHRIRESIVATMERQARSPTVLVAEDIHWADDASLLVLVDALQIAETLPVAVVLTCRTHPRHSALNRVLDLAVRRHDPGLMSLRPLDGESVRALAAAAAGAHRWSGSDVSLDAAGGNPFLVLEVVRAWKQRQPGDCTGVPLERIVHLHDLEPRALSFLRVAAILGGRFSLSTLGRMLGSTLPEVASLAQENSMAGVITVSKDGWMFRHDLIREAIYAEIPSEMRASLHRLAASVMTEQGATPVEIAEHLVRGSVPGDADAATMLTDAAADLVSVDPVRALELLDRVAEIDPQQLVARRPTWIESRIRALAAIGRLDEALTIGRGLTAMGDARGRADLAEVLAGLALLANQPNEALHELEHARASVSDPVHCARLQAQSSLMRMAVADVETGLAEARSAARSGAELRDPVARSLGLSVEGRLLTFGHHYERGRAIGQAAVSATEVDQTGESHRWLPWFFLGLTELDLGHLDAVDDAVKGGRRAARFARTPWAEPLYTALEASAALRTGRIEDAVSLAVSSIEQSRSLESTQALAWAHATAALAALHLGDAYAARDQAREAQVAGASGSPLGIDHAVRAAALVRAADGDTEGALDELHAAWQLFEALGVRSSQPVLAPDLTSLALKLGRTGLATDVARALVQAADPSAPLWLRACALRCQGLATNDPGLLRRAIDIYRSTPRRLDLATTLLELADQLPLDEQIAPHAEALGLFESCGAVGDVARLTSDRTQGTSRSDAASDWDRLTPTEREIVALVCEGLTNSEVAERRTISRRTVESHLARAFHKLGVHTRSQLILFSMQRPESDDDR